LILSEAVEGFLFNKDGNSKDDLAPATLTLYKTCLTKLIIYLDDPDLKTINSKQLNGFMRYLDKDYRFKEKPISGHAQDNHWKAIRSFYNWAEKEFEIKKRPDRDLPHPIIVTEEVVPYTFEEVRKIIHACKFTKIAHTQDRQEFVMHRATSIRDLAIVYLLLDTGIRIGELCRLTMKDIKMDAGEITIRPYRTGKKSRSRTIPFQRGCKKHLWNHIHTSLRDATLNDNVFDITTSGLQTIFFRISERTKIPEVHAHRFRHTFAIQFLRNGGNVYTLQKILGHSDLTMCLRYLNIAKTDVENAHQLASPVDNWHL
jgi:integrase/recombinase XerD